MAEHAPYTPGWVDLASPDTAVAKEFYTQLFGWAVLDLPVEQAGGYGMFLLDGQQVAGFGPTMEPDHGVAWSTYVIVPDVDATLHAVERAGGKVLMPPLDVMTQGRMAVFADREGAAFSVWQPGEHRGAQLEGVPGSFCWAELASRDQVAAEAFYGAVFGWRVGRAADAEHYATFRIGDREVAGLWDALGRMPDEIPVHWMPHFAVADCDATVARALELCGAVRVPAIDIPVGRFALLEDAQGAGFGVVQVNRA